VRKRHVLKPKHRQNDKNASTDSTGNCPHGGNILRDAAGDVSGAYGSDFERFGPRECGFGRPFWTAKKAGELLPGELPGEFPGELPGETPEP
jgi:hypothetical protein